VDLRAKVKEKRKKLLAGHRNNGTCSSVPNGVSCRMKGSPSRNKFSIGGHEGYIIVGMYEEGGPGEIFIKMAKEGSTLSGFMDGLALSISIGLQYGVPLKALVDN